MFSVSASPFNSYARSLYGGWTQSANANAMDAEALRGFYGTPANAGTMYGDSKWANVILRFSKDAKKRLIAKKIKAATKDMMKRWRANETWRKNYNLALAAMRSPYKRTSLNDKKRAGIVAEFESLQPDTMGAAGRAWLSALSRVPFVADPRLPGVSAEGNALLYSAPDYEVMSITDPAAGPLAILDPYQARRAYLMSLLPEDARAAFANDTNETIETALRQQGIPFN